MENTAAIVTIYSSDTCGYCTMAKRLLGSKGVTPIENNVSRDPELLNEMILRSGRRTVPQIFIGDLHVGGCDDLLALDRQGRLEPALKELPEHSGPQSYTDDGN
jgi:glutaredoxin 3